MLTGNLNSLFGELAAQAFHLLFFFSFIVNETILLLYCIFLVVGER